jgi:hypothetical protein
LTHIEDDNGIMVPGRTVVVNVKYDEYDVYIGRGVCPKTGVRSKWGNPYRIGEDGDRAEVIRLYREYVLGNTDLLVSLEELRGKRLGCWCVSKPIEHARDYPYCHGEVLLELLGGGG